MNNDLKTSIGTLLLTLPSFLEDPPIDRNYRRDQLQEFIYGFHFKIDPSLCEDTSAYKKPHE